MLGRRVPSPPPGVSGHSTDDLAGFRQTTIGRRTEPLPGPLRPPTDAERAWVRRMSRTRTRVPKGVFRYRSMAEANADWERWHVELVAATVSGDQVPRRP